MTRERSCVPMLSAGNWLRPIRLIVTIVRGDEPPRARNTDASGRPNPSMTTKTLKEPAPERARQSDEQSDVATSWCVGGAVTRTASKRRTPAVQEVAGGSFLAQRGREVFEERGRTESAEEACANTPTEAPPSLADACPSAAQRMLA